jgi:hypothetical protein
VGEFLVFFGRKVDRVIKKKRKEKNPKMPGIVSG